MQSSNPLRQANPRDYDACAMQNASRDRPALGDEEYVNVRKLEALVKPNSKAIGKTERPYVV